jgi:hypothetical protein
VAQSAIDVISPAFEHAKKQLFQPFNFVQWARIAFLAMATGEMSTGSGCNAHIPTSFPNPHTQQNFLDSPADLFKSIDPALIGTLVLVALIGGIVLVLVWLYVSSISRFMLYETVVRRYCEIGPAWDRWHALGMRFFGWQLALMFVSLGIAALTLLPLLIALVPIIKNHGTPNAALFLAFLPFLLIFGGVSLMLLLIAVLTKDFVVPIMAVDGVGVIEGWRRLISIMRADAAQFAGYIGMKIVLAIGAGIMFGILVAIVVVILAIPGAIVGVAIVLAVKAAGLTWNVGTIMLTAIAAVLVFSALLYVVAFVCVPVAIFFPAYGLYFLAERMPGLRTQLIPPQPPPQPARTPAPLPSTPIS